MYPLIKIRAGETKTGWEKAAQLPIQPLDNKCGMFLREKATTSKLLISSLRSDSISSSFSLQPHFRVVEVNCRLL